MRRNLICLLPRHIHVRNSQTLLGLRRPEQRTFQEGCLGPPPVSGRSTTLLMCWSISLFKLYFIKLGTLYHEDRVSWNTPRIWELSGQAVSQVLGQPAFGSEKSTSSVSRQVWSLLVSFSLILRPHTRNQPGFSFVWSISCLFPSRSVCQPSLLKASTRDPFLNQHCTQSR